MTIIHTDALIRCDYCGEQTTAKYGGISMPDEWHMLEITWRGLGHTRLHACGESCLLDLFHSDARTNVASELVNAKKRP